MKCPQCGSTSHVYEFEENTFHCSNCEIDFEIKNNTTLSFEMAIQILQMRGTKIDKADLGYILTVLRDNVENDEVHDLLDQFLRESLKSK